MFKPFSICLAITVLNIGVAFASGIDEEDVESSMFVEPNFQNKSEIAAKKNIPSPSVCPDAPKPLSPCKSEPLLPSQPCPENWRVSGDFLYLLPTLDDTYFVIDSGIATTFPNGKRLNNDFDFNSAFRVGAEYACCDQHRELQASYSHLTAEQKKTVAGAHLWVTNGVPDLVSNFENYDGTASSTLNLLYQNVDLNLSQRVLDSHGLYVYIQPGIEYAYLRLDEEYFYNKIGVISEINQKSKTWGIGPQIGLGLDYNLYQGKLNCSATHALSITSLFSGSILMGRAKTENIQMTDGNSLLNINDEHTWRTIEALHARIGLNYLVRASKVGFSLGIGYEFNTYIRALTRVFFYDDVADGLCSSNYYNFDLQGLYVSGALSF